MERSTKEDNKGASSNKAALTGAAWVDKPVKADGMTSAEEFTNTKLPKNK